EREADGPEQSADEHDRERAGGEHEEDERAERDAHPPEEAAPGPPRAIPATGARSPGGSTTRAPSGMTSPPPTHWWAPRFAGVVARRPLLPLGPPLRRSPSRSAALQQSA